MSIEQAIYILDPETSMRALYGYNHEEGVALVEEACRVACECMRRIVDDGK